MANRKRGLIVVESPAKAKKIAGYVGNDYSVMASVGHIRDLPQKAADIPKSVKDEPWSRLGVNPNAGFEPIYVVPPDKKKVVKELKAALANADELILATDEDREGEAIGWHVLEVLQPKVPVKRMTFSEITKKAILQALENTRNLDIDLVEAQETRRVLDRLYGYTLSPLLWKKIAPKLSAGRVQSVATRILVQRELERLAFKKAEYWDIDAKVAPSAERTDEAFTVRLFEVKQDGAWTAVATGKDFEDETGQLKPGRTAAWLSQVDAVAMANRLAEADWTVAEVNKRPGRRKPFPPYVTSSMQQAANNVLGMTARQAMSTAQRLYEDGHITYMRTDSTDLSGEALNAAKQVVMNDYGAKHFAGPRRYGKSNQNAQEAHEAIRPAGQNWQTSKQKGLTGGEARLYDLIYARAVASQMADHEYETTTYVIEAGDGRFKKSGTVDTFLGWQAVMRDFFPSRRGDDTLPNVQQGQGVALTPLDPPGEGDDWAKRWKAIQEAKEAIAKSRRPGQKKADQPKIDVPTPNPAPLEHFTQPPARYTEATLVKKLEEEGVGRPSTYASIISTIQDRGYARKSGSQLVPTFTAMAVTRLLEDNFPDLVDLKFTAAMEQQLDDIAGGQMQRAPYLDRFYAGDNGLDAQVKDREEGIDPRNACTLHLDGLESSIRVGRYGPYFEKKAADGELLTASLPDEIAPADVSNELAEELIELKSRGPQSLGMHPAEGLPIYMKVGPFGTYLQLGEDPQEGEKKPKRVSVPKNVEPSEVDLKLACDLLSLPRRIGHHPVDGKVVNAGVGRFGPYVQHAGRYKGLEKDDNVLTIDMNRAVELIKQIKGKKEPLRVIGEHPETGQILEIHEGKYGPYIKHGTLNATLPKEREVAEVTLAEAVDLIQKKADKSGKTLRKAAKKKGAKKAAKKSATKASKKSTKKKSTKKKAAKKKSS